MKLSFRWYGPDDSVSLHYIRQIPGMYGIVTALHHLPPGEVWDLQSILKRRDLVESQALHITVIESVPVHEDIKLGRETRDRYIANYCRTIENLGKAGIDTVCYNFMPVFDWSRTNLAMILPDGSSTLSFDQEALKAIDLSKGSGNLPGWGAAFTKAELAAVLKAYSTVASEQLWDHLGYFLDGVMPAAIASGVKLAIHPDDPPWSIFGLPRIITDAAALARLLGLYDHTANGLTFCTGSLGASESNDLPAMIKQFADRIHFMHCRNVQRSGEKKFHESPHRTTDGSVDMLAVMQALYKIGYSGPLRPDHGRMIWGEKGRPGYGLFDRALGATYLNGIWEGLGGNRIKS